MTARLDESMPVGNEGGGVVVAAGASPEAQALMGKTVGIARRRDVFAIPHRAERRIAWLCPRGRRSKEAASCFVNPLTALAMVETMRMEGHTALVHTAAASNLGQMLNKICLKDGVQLVNIVRSAEQAKILTNIGATHIVASTAPSFMEDLVKALAATGATLAFDAIGGGKLAGQILTGMEIAINMPTPRSTAATAPRCTNRSISTARSTLGPTELNRAFGIDLGRQRLSC